MADNDNKELMEFLGKQFENIDKRFEGIEKRLDNTATKDDIEDVKRHTGVLIEAIDRKIDIVIEGLMGEQERHDRDVETIGQEHHGLEKRVLINTADISALDQRVGRLEGRT